MSRLWIRLSGGWYSPKKLHLKVGGTWRTAKKLFVKKDGVWREVAFTAPAAATNANLNGTGFNMAEIIWLSSGATSPDEFGWATPQGSASGLFLKFVRSTGPVPFGDALATWLPMTSNRSLYIEDYSGTPRTAEGVYYVSTGGSDATIIGQGNWTLRVTAGIEQ